MHSKSNCHILAYINLIESDIESFHMGGTP
jgi:hypothetical protein